MFLSLTTLFKALSFLLMSKGYHVGSEFWSLPQHYGDEMSGITATLTQTEQGRQKPVTRIAQPRSIRQEAGTSLLSASSSLLFFLILHLPKSINLQVYGNKTQPTL